MKRTPAPSFGYLLKPCAGSRRCCESCAVRGKSICAGLTPPELNGLREISRHRSLRAGQQIVSGQDTPDYFSIIVAGSVKLTKSLSDGRQQIVGLLFPSDFVGWPIEMQVSSSAEAATDLELCSFPVVAFERLLHDQPGIQNSLLRYAFAQLDAAHDWMLLLGRMTAREKVASLFSKIATRSRGLDSCDADERGRERFQLPLSRSDIADFLGLTVETVSRQLHNLKRDGVIRLDGTRGVTVLDPARLQNAATSPFV